MSKKLVKKDAGTIFNPVMYLAVIIFAAQLMVLFIGYRRMMWLSDTMTNSMTDALLGAATLNEEELYNFGSTDELKILDPKEKYDAFSELLKEELGLDDSMKVGEDSIPFVEGAVHVEDFVVYSASGKDITVYDFDETGSFTTSVIRDGVGLVTSEHGEVIEDTALLARIGFSVNFMGITVPAEKYHMVDLTR